MSKPREWTLQISNSGKIIESNSLLMNAENVQVREVTPQDEEMLNEARNLIAYLANMTPSDVPINDSDYRILQAREWSKKYGHSIPEGNADE